MKYRKIHQIVLQIGKDFGPAAEQYLAELGISSYILQTARSVVGRETRGLVSVFKPEATEEDPVTIISFLVSPKSTRWVSGYLADKLSLSVPGRGSLMVVPVTAGVSPADRSADVVAVKPEGAEDAGVLLLSGVTEIVSIVQRGEGTNISKAALNLGQSAPGVTHGIGMGLREKLSLIRITFPRDKEIMRIIANADEANDAFDKLVEAAQLDQPGKGFIYISPLHKAVPNTLLFRGSQRHAATMEQVIQAIDSIHGGARWRQKRIDTQANNQKKRKYLNDMAEITVQVADGQSQRLVLAAMGAGASGATISKARGIWVLNGERQATGLELLFIIVPSKSVDTILDAIDGAGLFEEKLNGGVTTRPVYKACTYLG